MSNGVFVPIPEVVEDEMIFVAYDTHLYLIYYRFFFSLLLVLRLGGARMLEMLYY